MAAVSRWGLRILALVLAYLAGGVIAAIIAVASQPVPVACVIGTDTVVMPGTVTAFAPADHYWMCDSHGQVIETRGYQTVNFGG
jgi:hypothetical protein